MEITKKKEQVKSGLEKELIETEGQQKLLRNTMKNDASLSKARAGDILQNFKKDLDNSSKNE